MCDSRRPENGADSIEVQRYSVHLVEPEGPAWFMTVTASSIEQARSIARNRAYESGSDAVAVIGCKVATDAA